MDKKVIESYFRLGLFTEDDLTLFVSCNWISDEEKTKIVNNEELEG